MSTASLTELDAAPVDDERDSCCTPVQDLSEATRVFMAERTRLLRTAYRVVDDPAAAEDVVQEVWLRWQRVDRGLIQNPPAFLSTATTHIAINVVQSAEHRREVPCPLSAEVVGTLVDPTENLERSDQIERTLAFLIAKLSRPELAALLLRICFDYPYAELGDLLGTSAPNARQLVHRALVSVNGHRWRHVDGDQYRSLVARFHAAAERGDMHGLVSLLVANASSNRRAS
jgi:RNA polymerase sigma factor (sigma-70 family)